MATTETETPVEPVQRFTGGFGPPAREIPDIYADVELQLSAFLFRLEGQTVPDTAATLRLWLEAPTSQTTGLALPAEVTADRIRALLGAFRVSARIQHQAKRTRQNPEDMDLEAYYLSLMDRN